MSLINGVVIGTVKSVDDPDGMGRILVEYATMPGRNRSFWAPVASLMAGGGRGAWFMPEVDDEALIAFDYAESNSPYIIGFLWNGQDKPPSGHQRERMIRSKNGHIIRFLDATPDSGSQGALVIEDAHGNRITLSNGKIKIKSVGLLELEAPTIRLQGPDTAWKRIVSPNNNPI